MPLTITVTTNACHAIAKTMPPSYRLQHFTVYLFPRFLIDEHCIIISLTSPPGYRHAATPALGALPLYEYAGCRICRCIADAFWFRIACTFVAKLIYRHWSRSVIVAPHFRYSFAAAFTAYHGTLDVIKNAFSPRYAFFLISTLLIRAFDGVQIFAFFIWLFMTECYAVILYIMQYFRDIRLSLVVPIWELSLNYSMWCRASSSALEPEAYFSIFRIFHIIYLPLFSRRIYISFVSIAHYQCPATVAATQRRRREWYRHAFFFSLGFLINILTKWVAYTVDDDIFFW